MPPFYMPRISSTNLVRKRLSSAGWRTLPLAGLLGFTLTGAVLGQRPPSFQHEVRPILERSCFQCHGEEQKMGGLDLRSIAASMTGGSSGPAFIPGDPNGSLLIEQLESGKMPAGGSPLAPEEIQLIRAWVQTGRFPSLGAAQDEARQAKITEADRRHWSFQPPTKREAPAVAAVERVRNPIDAFLLEKLESRGWSFNPDADRRILVRRAYVDLTGLPPSPEQTEAFVADPDPDAYARLIDALLASPRYGERWGRHWLDVAGYSDSVGNAADELRPQSWEYRDWVIRALNEDKGYDRFLLEQLAGDQLVNYEPGTKPRPDQIDLLIATGFLRLPPDITDTQTIYQVDKYFDAQQTTVETSMKAILGLTIGCARCHDHRFDPILQEDYYKLTAVYQPAFDPEKWVPAALGFGHWPTRYVLDAEPEHREAYIAAALEEYPAIRREKNRVAAEYRRIARAMQTEAAVKLPDPDALEDGDTPVIDNREIDKLHPELAAQAAEVKRREQAYKDLVPRRIWAAWDVSKEPSPTYLLIRGNYLSPAQPVDPGVPTVLDDPAKPFEFPEPQPEWNHTGRRLILAKWLTRPDHPLTARVMVNRVWQFHFGEGIVRTPDDFGTQGAAPTHPELLDWLTVDFVQNGWSLKHLHRRIMLSSAYRQSSAERAEAMASDPTNKLLWRKSPLRVEAEVLRDSMLALSGRLDGKMFGQYEPLMQNEDGQWVIDERQGNDRRRSLYITNRRSGTHGFMLAFDAPPMDNGNMPQRFRSALPTQSLALMNGAFVLETAEALAERARKEGGDMDASLRRLFELVYGRAARTEELLLAHNALEASNDLEAGWRTVCQALLASNEFLYVFREA